MVEYMHVNVPTCFMSVNTNTYMYEKQLAFKLSPNTENEEALCRISTFTGV
jgi:hypothetical protein